MAQGHRAEKQCHPCNSVARMYYHSFQIQIPYPHKHRPIPKLFRPGRPSLTLWLFLSWLLPVAAGALGRRVPQTRPNILLIIADDLRPDLVGSYGNENFARTSATPNLDRFAEEGIRFDQAFTTSPLCAPARFSLNTGHYNSRRSQVAKKRKVPPLLDSVLAPEERLYYVTNNGMLTDSEVAFYKNRTVGAVLRQNGYNCGGIGKWHMGAGLHEDAFNFSYLMATNSQDHAAWNISAGAPGHNPEELTRQALKFLEKQTNTEPWFLYLSYTLPHSPYDMRQLLAEDPFTGQEPFLGPWERDSRGLRKLDMSLKFKEQLLQERQKLKEQMAAQGWLDAPADWNKYEASVGALAWLDAQIGAVLTKLDTLKFVQNTVVVFTADHGIVLPLGVGKGSLHNEGVRIPLLMRWKGRVLSGTVTNLPVSLLDLFPTFLELAGSRNMLASLELQGNSLTPVLFNNWPDESLFSRPIFLEVGIARAVLLDGWKFISVGPANSTATGAVCAESYGDYMSEKRTGRLEKSFFCHRLVCAAEQLYRYSDQCEQSSLASAERDVSNELRLLVQEHIKTNEGSSLALQSEQPSPWLVTELDGVVPVDMKATLPSTQQQLLMTTRVTYEEQPGRVGCSDRFSSPKEQAVAVNSELDLEVPRDVKMSGEIATTPCDYRWHTYFANQGMSMSGTFLWYSNGSSVPLGSPWSSASVLDMHANEGDTGSRYLPFDRKTTTAEAVAFRRVPFSAHSIDGSLETRLSSLTSDSPLLPANMAHQNGISAKYPPSKWMSPVQVLEIVPQDTETSNTDRRLEEELQSLGNVAQELNIRPQAKDKLRAWSSASAGTPSSDSSEGESRSNDAMPKTRLSAGKHGSDPEIPVDKGQTTMESEDADASGDPVDVVSPGARTAMQEAKRALAATGAEQAVQDAIDEVHSSAKDWLRWTQAEEML